MYFFAAFATILSTTPLSVLASPHALPAAAPMAVAVAADPLFVRAHPLYPVDPITSRHHSGRRLSRKVRRHGNHGGTTTATAFTTVTTDAASDDGSCTPDTSDQGASTTTTTTRFVTITSGADASTSTSTDAIQPAATDGVIIAHSDQCGDPNATRQPTATGGPNGDQNWLNCGVDGAGWIPPPITFSNLVYSDFDTILQQTNTPFEPCRPYLELFNNASRETGDPPVPPIFLASIALQESGCRPDVTGRAGEIGMMQITQEKCPRDDPDPRACYDPMENIRIGAKYFMDVLRVNDGNVAKTMGEYNGWFVGLTSQKANQASLCAQHNNLNYLQNVFNGYLQGIDPSSLRMGIYFGPCDTCQADPSIARRDQCPGQN